MSFKNLKNKNPCYEVKAKILKMSYNKENNLFQLLIQDMDKNKQTGIAIKGTDWGITSDVPDDIIEQFCKDMVGKEKNLHIEVDELSFRNIKKDEEGKSPQEEIDKVSSNLDKYPINEIRNLYKEGKIEN